MADNVAITPGVGATVAADDIAGVLHQRVKLSLGADGSAVDAVAGAGAAGTGVLRTVPATDSLPPIGGAYTDRSIANLAGSSETLMAANAARRILIVHNIGATAIAVNLTGGTASLTVGGSINIIAGASLIIDTYPPVGAITIIGTISADVTAYEG